MKYIEDLIPMKLYSSKTKLYLPINDKDKTKNSSVQLLSYHPDNIIDMLNSDIFINNNRFSSYYADKSVELLINNNINEAFTFKNDDELFFTYVNGDSRMISKVDDYINVKETRELQRKLNNEVFLKSEIKVHFDSRDVELTGESRINSLNILKPDTNYDVNKYGAYDLYLKHELSKLLIWNINQNVSEIISTCTAIYMSNQHRYALNKEYTDVYIGGAIAIESMVRKEGPRRLVEMIKRDSISYMAKYGSIEFVKDLKKLIS